MRQFFVFILLLIFTSTIYSQYTKTIKSKEYVAQKIKISSNAEAMSLSLAVYGQNIGVYILSQDDCQKFEIRFPAGLPFSYNEYFSNTNTTIYKKRYMRMNETGSCFAIANSNQHSVTVNYNFVTSGICKLIVKNCKMTFYS